MKVPTAKLPDGLVRGKWFYATRDGRLSETANSVLLWTENPRWDGAGHVWRSGGNEFSELTACRSIFNSITGIKLAPGTKRRIRFYTETK